MSFHIFSHFSLEVGLIFFHSSFNDANDNHEEQDEGTIGFTVIVVGRKKLNHSTEVLHFYEEEKIASFSLFESMVGKARQQDCLLVVLAGVWV